LKSAYIFSAKELIIIFALFILQGVHKNWFLC